MKLTRQLVRSSGIVLGAVGLSLLAARPAEAVPSFSRQTGMACDACHTVYPNLTPFGRLFKMNGFTMENIKEVTATTPKQNPELRLNEIPPFSFAAKVSFTHIGKTPADSNIPTARAQNDNLMFPQNVDLYYAGAVAPKLGAFFQVDYDQQGGSLSLSMGDVRFANQGKLGNGNFLYGVSLNDIPTFSDPWQTTPAYWFPTFSSENWQGEGPAPQIQAQGMMVWGIGPYLYFPNLIGGGSLYVSAEGYRSNPPNQSGFLDSSDMGVISGIAPYWRVAWEKDWGHNVFEIGTYGFAPHLYNALPGEMNALSGATDDFTDVAGDASYQYIGNDNIFSVSTTEIHEMQTWHNSFGLGNTSNSSDTLDHFQATGSWYYHRRYGASMQLFDTWGSSDANLYTSGNGFSNGSPDTDGVMMEADYMPWENTRLIAQYTAYNKFQGTTNGASDNNTFVLGLWMAF